MKSNEAHLWYVRPDQVPNRLLSQRYGHLLTDAERRRIDRYHFTRDQHIGFTTRVSIRCLLSRYANVKPSEWRFQDNEYGRPEIVSPSYAGGLQFSIAHTSGLILVLIGKNRRVGVDVERIPYNGPCLELADRYFSPSEAKAIRALPPSEQPMRFIEYWVLKESFTKAQGMGLTIPLNTFSFHKIKTRGSEIEIRFSPSYEDEGLLWQFNLNAIGDKHVAATAIERSEGEALCLSRYEWTPPLDVNIGHARMGTPSKRHQSA